MRLGFRICPSGILDAVDVVPDLLSSSSGPALRGGLEMLEDAIFQWEVIPPIRSLHPPGPGQDHTSNASHHFVTGLMLIAVGERLSIALALLARVDSDGLQRVYAAPPFA